ncbi:EthD family reductase [Rhodococcus sp. GB-02]|nr:EthD family reductase [Rhodococcus erythropolis]
MIKLVSMWRHNPELGAQMSDEHYFQRHTPMALSLLSEIPGFLKYTQNSVVAHSVHRENSPEPEERDPEFHTMLELYFTDEDAVNQLFSNPEMARLFDDHPNFQDYEADPSMSVYIVRERVALERGIDGSLMVPASSNSTAGHSESV